MPLHSSLGNNSETLSKQKTNNNNNNNKKTKTKLRRSPFFKVTGIFALFLPFTLPSAPHLGATVGFLEVVLPQFGPPGALALPVYGENLPLNLYSSDQELPTNPSSNTTPVDTLHLVWKGKGTPWPWPLLVTEHLLFCLLYGRGLSEI